MAYMLLLAWCVAAVTAKQYGEYPDIHIPNYGIPNEYEGIRDGSPSDEYSGHLHDASIPLDYKYEEDSHRKITKSNIDTYDSEWWMKRAKSQRGALRSPEDSMHAKNKFNREDDKAQNIKSNHRYSKQRTRQDVNEGDEKPSARRSKKYSQNRKDVSDIDRKEYVDKEFTDSKHKYSDVDESSYVDSFTRIKSLKHRGRHRKDIENDPEITRFDTETIDSDAYEDDDAQIEKRLKGHVDKIITSEKREHRLTIPESDDVMDSDLRESEYDRVATYYPKFEAFTKPTRDRPMIQKRPLLLNTKDKFRRSYDDVDDNEPAEKKLKSKPDDYYSNYERVQNMKNKITSHITRTTGPTNATNQTLIIPVAERELIAALESNELRRRRKVAADAVLSSTSERSLTFAPLSVEASLEKQWNNYVAVSTSSCLHIPVYLHFLALIKYAQVIIYAESFCQQLI